MRTANDENFASEVFDTPGIVLVEIGASWCGPCRRLEPILRELSDGGLSVVKVDADTSPIILKELRIQHIPTMMIFRDGEVKKVLIGAPGKAALEAEIAQV